VLESVRTVCLSACGRYDSGGYHGAIAVGNIYPVGPTDLRSVSGESDDPQFARHVLAETIAFQSTTGD
jgi:hypothetical protein